MSKGYEGWDVEIFSRKDNYIMLRPCFLSEGARHSVVREGCQQFHVYANSKEKHIGVVANAEETRPHTPQERNDFLTNFLALVDLQLKGEEDV